MLVAPFLARGIIRVARNCHQEEFCFWLHFLIFRNYFSIIPRKGRLVFGAVGKVNVGRAAKLKVTVYKSGNIIHAESNYVRTAFVLILEKALFACHIKKCA